MPRGWRASLRVARNPGLLAFVGAVLLMCAPVLPGLSRLVVLPALLLAPGYALLRLLGQATGPAVYLRGGAGVARARRLCIAGS